MDVWVRPAHRSDAKQLARVHLQSWRWAYRGLLPDSYLDGLREKELAARWGHRLTVSDPEDMNLVVEHREKIAGFVTFGPHRDDPSWLGYAGEIHMLYLHPDRVGKGMGRALLTRALDELAGCRCHWAVVWVLARNQRAREFYERAGFRLDGARRWDPFGERSVPVVRYAKALNPVVDFDALRGHRSKIG